MSFLNKHKNYSILFLGLAFVYFVILSLGAGISGDEDINYKYAYYVWDYLFGGPDGQKSLEKVRGPDWAIIYTYDLVCVALDKIFSFEDIHQVRHIWTSIIGWGVVVVTFLLGRKYFDVWTGMIAGGLLMVSPRFMGHALNNTRDVPFAFGYMASVYGILLFANQYKKPKWKVTFICMLCLGLALNGRIGGLILYPFIGLVLLIQIFMDRKWKMFSSKYLIDYVRLIKHLVVMVIGSYGMMLLFWPFGHEGPFSNPFEALGIASKFAVGIRQLFEGNNITSLQLPWYYTIKWIFISAPLITLIGLIGGMFYFVKKRKRSRKIVFLSLVSFAMVPLLYIVFKGSNVYGGWRHSTFVYPPLTLLAAIGIRYGYHYIKNKNLRYGFIALFVIGGVLPLLHIIRNHPVHYVYFNELVGGVKDAYSNYEMDYYMHSVKPGVDWLREEGILNATDSLILASNHQYSAIYYNRDIKNIKVIYTRYYERLKREWDYAVYVNVYIDQPELKNGQFPPPGTIHTIDVDGKPVCAIVKNPSKAALGYDKDMAAKDYRSAINKLKRYNRADANNFECNMSLAIAYQALNQRDSLSFYLSRAQAINPMRFGLYTQPRK